jgi:hypothetical protein
MPKRNTDDDDYKPPKKVRPSQKELKTRASVDRVEVARVTFWKTGLKAAYKIIKEKDKLDRKNGGKLAKEWNKVSIKLLDGRKLSRSTVFATKSENDRSFFMAGYEEVYQKDRKKRKDIRQLIRQRKSADDPNRTHQHHKKRRHQKVIDINEKGVSDASSSESDLDDEKLIPNWSHDKGSRGKTTMKPAEEHPFDPYSSDSSDSENERVIKRMTRKTKVVVEEEEEEEEPEPVGVRFVDHDYNSDDDDDALLKPITKTTDNDEEEVVVINKRKVSKKIIEDDEDEDEDEDDNGGSGIPLEPVRRPRYADDEVAGVQYEDERMEAAPSAKQTPLSQPAAASSSSSSSSSVELVIDRFREQGNYEPYGTFLGQDTFPGDAYTSDDDYASQLVEDGPFPPSGSSSTSAQPPSSSTGQSSSEGGTLPSGHPPSRPDFLTNAVHDLFLRSSDFSATPLLLPITAEEQVSIDRLLMPPSPDSMFTIVCQHGRQTCNAKTIYDMRPGTWITDEAINYYRAMVQERENRARAVSPGRMPSHIFGTSFFHHL